MCSTATEQNLKYSHVKRMLNAQMVQYFMTESFILSIFFFRLTKAIGGSFIFYLVNDSSRPLWRVFVVKNPARKLVSQQMICPLSKVKYKNMNYKC